METLIAATVGALVAAAVYLMLSRSVMKFLIGLVLISNAANLVLFASGRLIPGAPSLIAPGADAPAGVVANALPQALVLTAIVIGFGLFAFALTLFYKTREAIGTIDSDAMRIAEPREDRAEAVAAAAPATPASVREAAE